MDDYSDNVNVNVALAHYIKHAQKMFSIFVSTENVFYWSKTIATTKRTVRNVAKIKF